MMHCSLFPLIKSYLTLKTNSLVVNSLSPTPPVNLSSCKHDKDKGKNEVNWYSSLEESSVELCRFCNGFHHKTFLLDD